MHAGEHGLGRYTQGSITLEELADRKEWRPREPKLARAAQARQETSPLPFIRARSCCSGKLFTEQLGSPEISWLFLILATPLIFNPLGFQVFDLPKIALVRTLTFGAAILWLLPRFSRGPLMCDLRAQISWSDARLWAAVLGLVMAASTSASIDPTLSFWGSYNRQEGLYTTLAYLLLFTLVASKLRSKGQAERLLLATALGGFPIVTYGILQWLTLDPIPWHMADKSTVIATLGRSNFVGSYLVMSIPLSAGAFVLNQHLWARAAVGATLVGSFAVLVFANARSAWAAIVVAALVILALRFLQQGGWRRLLFLVGIAITAGGIFAVTYVGTLKAVGQLNPDRILPLSQLGGSIAARITIWQASLELIAERPVLGFGPDTFALAFYHVFPPQLVFYQGRDGVTDRAHNILLQQAATSGIIGLFAYVALVGSVLAILVLGLRRSNGRERILLGSILMAVVGHLVDSLFTFDVASTAVVFWAAAGAGVGLSRAAEARGSPELDLGHQGATKDLLSCRRLMSSGLAAAAMAAVLASNLAPIVADTYAGLSFVPGSPLDKRTERAQRATLLWPFEPAYRAMLGGLYAERARNEADPRPSLEAAEAEFATVVSARPLEPGAWAALGSISGQRALAMGDSSALAEAEAAYDHAIDLAPNMATLHAAYGTFELAAGRFDLAATKLERATALDPTDARAWGYLAEAYRGLGRVKEAATALSTALRVGQEIRAGGR